MEETYRLPPERRVLGRKASELTWRRWQVFKSDRRAMISLILFIVLFAVAILSPVLANDRPILVKYKGEILAPFLINYPEEKFGGFLATTNYKDDFIKDEIEANGWILWPPVPYHYRRAASDLNGPAPTAPDRTHWLGTDDQGRDLIARLLYGLRISIVFGFMYVAITSFIGIIAGALQGYYGGWLDLIFQRILEIYGSIPQFFVLIILVSIIAPGFWTLLLILCVFGWTAFVGATRAEFLRARNFEFVQAARALGVSNRKIMWRHLFPNAMIAPITFMPFALASSVTVLSSLDFLGLGMPPGSPSLGEMASQALRNLENAPHIMWVVSIALGLLTTLLVFIGEGVRNALDPRKMFAIAEDAA